MILDLEGKWSKDDVRNLIKSIDDDRNWRMIIDRSGKVYFVDVDAYPNFNYENMHGYYEILLQGNGYVGGLAAADDKYIEETVKSLKENWPNLKGDRYIDH